MANMQYVCVCVCARAHIMHRVACMKQCRQSTLIHGMGHHDYCTDTDPGSYVTEYTKPFEPSNHALKARSVLFRNICVPDTQYFICVQPSSPRAYTCRQYVHTWKLNFFQIENATEPFSSPMNSLYPLGIDDFYLRRRIRMQSKRNLNHNVVHA